MKAVLIQDVQNEIYEDVAEFLKVMAHPVRLKIIQEVSKHRKLNVKQLTEILDIPQSTTSQHLTKMKNIVLRRKRKGIEMYYYITNEKAEQVLTLLTCTE
ncbi:ArsR/SmtB family transcription factor [Bacillus cereus]|uniref:HTH arsR-type domain-containing protein n=1 Tax=Bacillus cereus MC67 TaxID=1053219 RepID=J8ES38_BACCE|nr:metalloregulator ArsR/SmtB family transcription factor [Bacillus cereus]EJQ91325.1 hypothetical protein II3_05586 [Bacillus cereus MC67]EOP00070.1 hypothetical protein II1_05219 [Bacillus cereus MC118]